MIPLCNALTLEVRVRLIKSFLEKTLPNSQKLH